jgi:hypothetical protein
MAKFKQHAGPRRVLRSTGTATIVGLMGKGTSTDTRFVVWVVRWCVSAVVRVRC